MIKKLLRFIKRHWHLLFANVNIDSHVVAYTLIALLSSLLAINNKVLFIITSIYILFVFIRTKSATTTFIYAFLWLQSYQVGQLYPFRVIEPEMLLKGSLYPEGRSLYYVATPALFVLIAATFSLPIIIMRYKGTLVLRYTTISYALFILAKLVSSLSSTILPSLSVFQTLNDVFLFGFILASCFYLTAQTSQIRYTVIYTSLLIIMLNVFFEFGIVMIQMLKHNIIGLAIESTKVIPLFGFGADENPLQFRPVGLSTHANILTIRFIQYLFTIATASLMLPRQEAYNRVRFLSWFVSFLCLVVILIAQSRTGYISTLLPLVGIIIINRHAWSSWILQVRLYLHRHRLFLVALIVITTTILTDRLLYTQYVFTESGGWNTRSLLIQEAVKIINKYPVLGVGAGMFIPAAFNEQRYETFGLSIMRYFPESVHNGYLLLLAENGGIAALLFVVATVCFTIEIVKSSFTTLIKSLIIASAIAGLIYMTMQPYVMVLPLSMVFVYFIVASKYEKTPYNKIH